MDQEHLSQIKRFQNIEGTIDQVCFCSIILIKQTLQENKLLEQNKEHFNSIKVMKQLKLFWLNHLNDHNQWELNKNNLEVIKVIMKFGNLTIS